VALDIETLHHVSLPVSDLARSKRFYATVLGLTEIARPPFDFPGAWYRLGDRQLHLIGKSASATYRGDKLIDSRDIHFAIRVRSLRAALQALREAGFDERAEDELLRIKVSLKATAGFPQIYILDPDRHVIEINAQALDG
jgi:catechol 2,3-dioxygenase-like lactoylglutathione lyase family enzyme